VELEYFFEHPRNQWTFQMPKLRKWVEGKLEGDVLNLFGGMTKLSHPSGGLIIHNEIREDIEADYHRDSYDLTQWADSVGRYHTVVFDPPFSAHQAVVSYGVKKAQQVTHARDVVEYVLRPGGRVISLGFNSTGMSKSRGFTKEHILLVHCGASHNDYITVVERRNPTE
jgi:hypothetical protein